MPLAQVLRFDERQSMGRPRRKPEPTECIVIRFPHPAAALPAPLVAAEDDDQIAGRGRDPG